MLLRLGVLASVRTVYADWWGMGVSVIAIT
jgi:hypothetical protein